MEQLGYRMHADGRVSIFLEGTQVLTTGWGIDRASVCSVQAKADAGQAEIRAEQGRFTASVQPAESGGICLRHSAQLDREPRFVYPVFEAAVYGLRGVYRQGFGLGGPSGWVPSAEISRQRIVYSYGMTVLKYDAGYLGIYAKDARRYIQRTEIHPDPVTEGVYEFSGPEDVYRVSVGFQTECTSRTLILPELFLIAAKTPDEVLDAMAQAVAADYRPPVPERPAYHWCSWYYYYNNFDLAQLREFLEGLQTLEEPVPLDYVQIDAGYFPSAGDWLMENGLWPGGLKAAFDLIRSYGYRPGIWIAPFMAGCRSRLFAEHPDWMLRDREGAYVKGWQMYNEPKVWGYQDEEYYVLDTSRPEAMDYLRSVFRTLQSWGAEFFKTDFMLWGIQDSAQVQRYTKGKTTVEYYRELMQAIHEEIGDSYWLGCIAPYLPSLGFVNGMRIAGDVGAQWEDDGFGPAGMIRQAVGDNHLNGRFWQNDPDALILRDFHVFLSERETVSLTLFQALSGGMIYTSDPLSRIAPRRRKLFEFVRPVGIMRPDLPLRESESPVIAMHHRLEDRHILFLFNPDGAPQTVYASLEELCGCRELYLTAWEDGWNAGQSPCSHWGGTIPPHGCVLLYGGETGPVTEIRSLWQPQ